ncbi:hypothetical protein NC652_002352 [Populus alba x Populus x berolinensis]|nr:hypothetical protein NC652_002352 [Populus alba x Populus x berolinensis]
MNKNKSCTHAGAQSVTFVFKNNCPYTVWPGTLTAAGRPPLSSTGFTLATGASSSLSVPVNWSGRLWARTQCSTDASGKFVCATADCASGVIECNGAGGSPGCSSTSCAANVNAVCDPSLAVRGPDGTVIACKSACLAFNQPQFCCTGEYNTPDCPQAYSYAYDDKTSTFTCPSGGNYLITFCP